MQAGNGKICKNRQKGRHSGCRQAGGGEWLKFTLLSSNAANTNNITHGFLARGVKRIGSQHFDPGEDIRCGLYTEEEVKGMLMRDDSLKG